MEFQLGHLCEGDNTLPRTSCDRPRSHETGHGGRPDKLDSARIPSPSIQDNINRQTGRRRHHSGQRVSFSQSRLNTAFRDPVEPIPSGRQRLPGESFVQKSNLLSLETTRKFIRLPCSLPLSLFRCPKRNRPTKPLADLAVGGQRVSSIHCQD